MKMTLVAWDSIYQPRSHGGLGLRYMRDQNTFFFYEDWVNLVSKDSALWDVVRQIVSIPPPHPSSGSDKGIEYNSSCSLYEHETEDTHHVLQDCSATKKTENLEVVRALQGSVTMDSRITVLRRVQRITRIEGQWWIRYVPREVNLVAD
ncbi:hypothetical protein Golob_022715 [Gossypium lobatum]|uniref:Uncharacterized protein n=1 Tax=Gossypium lobatum TaxID=34289 RepID=A0A7J8LHD3_9ROSI|nr:hypothetical protein [Gossypium lobatum]